MLKKYKINEKKTNKKKLNVKNLKTFICYFIIDI